MKPVNFIDKNCESKSANCVLWDHDDLVIGDVTICRGQSIAYPIYYLAEAVKDLQEQTSLENYDIACLSELGNPTDFKGLIQNLITKVCSNG